jgi:peptidyl-tRNA hydrolase
VDYVLGEFDTEEARALSPLIDRAGEAAITVLTDGIRAAMNRFNMREP